MTETVITINNKTFKLKFGLKVFRLLGSLWGTSTLNTTMARLKIFETASEDLSFEQLDMIYDLIISAIEASEENTETLSRDEIDDLLLTDTEQIMGVIQTVINGLAASVPQSNPIPGGKSKPATKKK
jgi:hypothetical protein